MSMESQPSNLDGIFSHPLPEFQNPFFHSLPSELLMCRTYRQKTVWKQSGSSTFTVFSWSYNGWQYPEQPTAILDANHSGQRSNSFRFLSATVGVQLSPIFVCIWSLTQTTKYWSFRSNLVCKCKVTRPKWTFAASEFENKWKFVDLTGEIVPPIISKTHLTMSRNGSLKWCSSISTFHIEVWQTQHLHLNIVRSYNPMPSEVAMHVENIGQSLLRKFCTLCILVVYWGHGDSILYA